MAERINRRTKRRGVNGKKSEMGTFPGGLVVGDSALSLLWFWFIPGPGTSACCRHSQNVNNNNNNHDNNSNTHCFLGFLRDFRTNHIKCSQCQGYSKHSKNNEVSFK